ncbi:MAG: hypothetical protein JWM25_1156 [Thermoleophilia bacterium]|nr:hypothetical protein [Thermoleophilia bacterium]
MTRVLHSLDHRIATLAMTLVMLLLAAPQAGATVASNGDSVGFGVAPLIFELEAKPGASVVQQIRVTNTDERATTFTFSKEDFEGSKADPDATPVLLGGKFESAISGYDWVTTPEDITVPAGQTKLVNVRVAVPADATGGHYTALFVMPTARTANALIAQSRMGVLFLMNAGGVPPPDLVVTEITQVGPNKTVTRYTNGGATAVKPTPRITEETRGPGSGTKRTIAEGTCTRALPGAVGECEIVTKNGTTVGGGRDGLIPGKRSLELVSPEGSSATEDLPTEWASTWSSLLLPLVGIALAVIYFLFLRRRLKTDDEDEAFELYAN